MKLDFQLPIANRQFVQQGDDGGAFNWKLQIGIWK
jgi:hypothetical protein